MRGAAAATSWWTGSSASAAGRAAGARPSRCWTAVPDERGRRRGRPAERRRPGDRRDARRRAPRLGRRHGDLRGGQARPAAAAGRSRGRPGARWSTSGSARTCTAWSPAVEQWEPPDVAAAWPVPGPGRRQVLARRPRRRRRRPDVHRRRGALHGRGGRAAGAGMVRYVGPPTPTDLVRARWPEVVPGAGRVQAWVARPGAGRRPRREPGRGRPMRPATLWPRTCRPWSTPGRWTCSPSAVRRRPCSPRTPASWPGCCTERTGDDGRAGRRSRPGRCAHARRRAELTGATVLLKGATCVLVRAGRPGPHRAQDGPAWLATAGSGDVLAGIAGTLLAAGLDPLRRRRRWPSSCTALAAPVANAGGPVPAGGPATRTAGHDRALLAEPRQQRRAGALTDWRAMSTTGLDPTAPRPVARCRRVAEVDLAAVRGQRRRAGPPAPGRPR